jgi:ABC-type Fe3+ transport system permease subunit
MASYRMGEAAVTALLLLGLSLGLFVALERLIGGGRDA